MTDPRIWPTRTCLHILANRFYDLHPLAGCSGKHANRIGMRQCIQCEWITPVRHKLTAKGYGVLVRYANQEALDQ